MPDDRDEFPQTPSGLHYILPDGSIVSIEDGRATIVRVDDEDVPDDPPSEETTQPIVKTSTGTPPWVKVLIPLLTAIGGGLVGTGATITIGDPPEQHHPVTLEDVARLNDTLEAFEYRLGQVERQIDLEKESGGDLEADIQALMLDFRELSTTLRFHMESHQ